VQVITRIATGTTALAAVALAGTGCTPTPPIGEPCAREALPLPTG